MIKARTTLQTLELRKSNVWEIDLKVGPGERAVSRLISWLLSSGAVMGKQWSVVRGR